MTVMMKNNLITSSHQLPYSPFPAHSYPLLYPGYHKPAQLVVTDDHGDILVSGGVGEQTEEVEIKISGIYSSWLGALC